MLLDCLKPEFEWEAQIVERSMQVVREGLMWFKICELGLALLSPGWRQKV